MSIFDKIKKLENNLDKCLNCEVKEGCDVLQTLHGVDFCDALKAMENPKNYPPILYLNLSQKTKRLNNLAGK